MRISNRPWVDRVFCKEYGCNLHVNWLHNCYDYLIGIACELFESVVSGKVSVQHSVIAGSISSEGDPEYTTEYYKVETGVHWFHISRTSVSRVFWLW